MTEHTTAMQLSFAHIGLLGSLVYRQSVERGVISPDEGSARLWGLTRCQSIALLDSIGFGNL